MELEDPDLIFLDSWEKVIKNQIVKFIKLKKKRRSYRCPCCGRWVNRIHDYRESHPKHINIANHPSQLIFLKRRFRCGHCSKRFLEPWDCVSKHRRVTNKLVQSSLMDLRLKISFTDVANKYMLSISTIMRDFTKHISYKTKPSSLPSVISIDEFKATASNGNYAFMITDPINKTIIDILPDRLKTNLKEYLLSFTNRKDVRIVVGDMWDTYRELTAIVFPNAIYVADRFHFVRHICWAFTDVRVKAQNRLLMNKSEKGYNFIKNKITVGLLNKHSKKITITEKWDYSYNSRTKEYNLDSLQRISKALSMDTDLETAYKLKEQFFDILKSSNFENAREHLTEWIKLCKSSKIKEFVEVSSTIANWLDEIVNSFIDDKKYSNAFIEGTNNKIKCIKRISFGYRLFHNFRSRILYIFGNPIHG
jgi:transposase